MSDSLFICLPIYLISVIWCLAGKKYLYKFTWVCLSAGTQERLSAVLRDVTGCWTITVEGTQSYRRSCRSKRQWRPAMSTPSARCWSRATRPRSGTPTAGHCCTSLRRRGRSDVCACSSNTEVKTILGQWRDVQKWFKVSVGKKTKNDQLSLMFTKNCGWFVQSDTKNAQNVRASYFNTTRANGNLNFQGPEVTKNIMKKFCFVCINHYLIVKVTPLHISCTLFSVITSVGFMVMCSNAC